MSNSPDGKISGEFRHKKKDGTIINVVIKTVPMKYGSCTARIALMQDITEQKRIEETLRQSENRFRFMLENSPIAVRITNMATNRVVFSNQRYAELIGSVPDQVLGINPKQYYVNPQEYSDVVEQLSKGERVTNKLIELLIPGELSETKWVLASYMHLEYQHEQAILGWFYDISDRKAMEEQVRHMAHYDPLTDLPNRTLFSDRMQQSLAIARREKTRLAIMFIDLDKFKPVNDTLGHDVGDLLLRDVAQRIQNCLRETDTVARIGGDEFIVLLPRIEAEQDAFIVAEKIRYSLNQPFELAGRSLSISSSTGIAIYPEHGIEENQLIKNADTAMYHAKASGRDNVKTYQSNMQG
jgi:diguanylate cyclase (GGDEF)-like protein/PAS domain S-box-containing protein